MKLEPFDPISAFAPWAGPEERALRLRLHKARDIAQSRACRSKHGGARSLYWMAAQMAGDWVFARSAPETLKDVLQALCRLFEVAGAFERLEARDVD